MAATGRFYFVSDRTVENVRKDRVPKNTIRHTTWSTNVYNAWVKERNEQFKDFQAERNEFQRIPNLDSIALIPRALFVSEMRNISPVSFELRPLE